MKAPKPPPIERPSGKPERMWPLDVSIAALAGLVLFLIVTRLRFDDPRPLFNAWTYVIAVPLTAMTLAFLSHGIVTRYVQKSIQLGFLFSVFVHLLLLILAINVIIFTRYFPDALTGVKPERSPISRTVPEYVFQTPQETAATPDWSQPVQVETTSRVMPQEQRQLPPVRHTEPKLEVPRPRELEQRPMQKFLMKRTQPTESQPQPTDSPAKLARRRSADDQATSFSSRTPTAPDVPAQAEVQETNVERPMTQQQRSRPTETSVSPAAPAELPVAAPSTARSIAGTRNRSNDLPMVGESGFRRQQRQPTPVSRLQPAGAAPAPPTVAVAAEDPSAQRMIMPEVVPVTRQGRTAGAQITMGQSATSGVPTNEQATSGAELSRNTLAARSGVPNVTAGNSRRNPGRTRRPTSGFGIEPAGAPDPSQSIAAAVGGSADNGSGTEVGDIAADRLGNETLAESAARRQSGSNIPAMSDSATGPRLDLMVEEGPVGLSNLPNGRPGVVPSDDQPRIASLDLTSGRRPRREVGGPITPFGSKIASVETYSRRTMRTRGGAAATPAGMVGPATEEAIERGLAYLAGIQNDDGSWSLQGHGSDVLLRSDTAATGLCLLAFQGAGYTHRQHQYADTVSRGLKFMLDNQRTNGDLYRKENAISNRNVALYSHGIAALALCEAYGMTQDPELRDPAQGSLNYIIGTQHRQRGGWRYTPQVSADTSVTGWMMMALKSGQLSGLEVPEETYNGIQRWLGIAQSEDRPDRYRYNPFAPDTPTQRHGKVPTPTMTSVGMLMRMYAGWRRDHRHMQSAADYLLEYPPQMGTPRSPQRDAYYWYYATQVMFHMGDHHWERWNRALNPLLLESQVKDGPAAGSWDPRRPVPDRWSTHAGRLYVTAMNLLNLEVYYRHLPIYEETAE